MSPTHHVIISAGTSAAFWYFTQSPSGTAACFLSGILIDIDHHLDYFLCKKELPLNYQKLYHFCEREKAGNLYLFLHSYELMAVFWAVIFYFQLSWLWAGLALGMTVHMLADQIFNPVAPLCYFLVYRAKQGFSRAKLLTDYETRE